MGYIMDLRRIAGVGHRPLMMVGAGVLLEDADGRVLLQKRADNHLWGYPAGSVELYEDVEAAARRECLEETGLTVGEMEFFNVYSGEKMHYIYPNGDEVSVVEIMFFSRDYSGKLVPQPDEVEELRFFAPDELPENEKISPPNLPALIEWKRRRMK